MSDLSDLQATETVRIVGSTSGGTEQTPIQSTSQGGLHTNLRDSNGNEIGGIVDPTSTSFGITVRNIPFCRSTYSVGVAGLVPVANATDIFTITGSASKTIYVKKITVSGTQSTASHRNILLIKRSTANSGGTSTTPTIVGLDSNNPVQTAVVRAYTANPTLGTTVGTLRAQTGTFPVPQPANAQGAVALNPVIWDFNIGDSQPVVLRGVAQVLSVNLNGVSFTGGSLSIYIEWIEE